MRLRPLLLLVPMVLLTGCDLKGCLPHATEQSGAGVVKIVNPPTTAAPGQVITLDLTGSYLNTQCVFNVATLWTDQSGWQRGYHDEAQTNVLFKPPANCNRFNRSITTTVPADFTGGKLYVHLNAKSETMALGFMSTGTYESADASFDVALTPGANTAPTARVFPHYLRMDAAIADLRVIDARTSTDPEGQTLSYSWDTNGDGTYGDTVEETGTAGVVRIPAASLPPLGPPFQFGVKVTDTGGLSSTATAKAETISGATDVQQTLVFSPTTGTIGAPTTVTVANRVSGDPVIICFDLDGDGRYTDAEATNLSPTTTFTPRAAGTQQIGAVIGNGSCADISDDIARGVYAIQQGINDAYTSSAARSSRATSAGYRAKARFSLGGATMVAIGTPTDTGGLSGITGRGTYTLRTPAKGNGATRPTGLQSFTNGDYVIRASSLDFLATSKTQQTLIGSSIMLLRGKDRALACLAVTGTPTTSTYVFTGGTGAAARLSGDATATNLRMRVKQTKAKSVSYKGKTQKKAIRSNATIAAGTATKATPLPAACAALKRYLP